MRSFYSRLSHATRLPLATIIPVKTPLPTSSYTPSLFARDEDHGHVTKRNVGRRQVVRERPAVEKSISFVKDSERSTGWNEINALVVDCAANRHRVHYARFPLIRVAHACVISIFSFSFLFISFCVFFLLFFLSFSSVTFFLACPVSFQHWLCFFFRLSRLSDCLSLAFWNTILQHFIGTMLIPSFYFSFFSSRNW